MTKLNLVVCSLLSCGLLEPVKATERARSRDGLLPKILICREIATGRPVGPNQGVLEGWRGDWGTLGVQDPPLDESSFGTIGEVIENVWSPLTVEALHISSRWSNCDEDGYLTIAFQDLKKARRMKPLGREPFVLGHYQYNSRGGLKNFPIGCQVHF